MIFRRALVVIAFGSFAWSSCGGEPSQCVKDTDCKGARLCTGGMCVDPPMGGGSSAGGTAGGSTAGGSTAGGSTAGGSTAGGSTAGGSTAGGSTAGGSTAGGSTAGGSTAGGSTAGGSTAGGPTAGGSTAGGSTAGGSTAGGSTAGGSTAGGSTSGGSTAGGSAGGNVGGGVGPLPDGGCQPESEGQLCATNARPCGALQATDSCGTARLVVCGQCSQAGGVPLLDAGTGTLTCIRGALEPGRPASPFAFELTRQHPTVDFLHRGLTDAGAPVLQVVLDLPLAYPNPVPALFTLVGDAGSATLTQLAESAMTTVAPGANAALRLGSRLAVDAEASSSRLAVGGLPPMLWYTRCSGVADIAPPESDATFCQANGFTCASVTATDNTGALRTATCGPCQGGQVCRPSTASGWPSMRCRACNVESDAQFCNRLGKDCGSVTALDDCDVMRTANCGTCTMPSICGSMNVCGGGSVTCTFYRNTQPPGSLGCDFGDAGINSVQTQTFTQLSFAWNPMRARYQHNTTVPSIILGGVLELYLYSATDTNVSWSEGGAIGTRSGNIITVNGQASRQSPPGCPNNTIHTSCVGAAPFVFVP